MGTGSYSLTEAIQMRDCYLCLLFYPSPFPAALCVMIIGFLPIDWSVKGKGEFLMAGVCAFNGVCLFIIGRTDDIWVAYVLYDVFRATYLTVITIAT